MRDKTDSGLAMEGRRDAASGRGQERAGQRGLLQCDAWFLGLASVSVRGKQRAGMQASYMASPTAGRTGGRRLLAMPSVQPSHRTAQPNSIWTMTTDFLVAQGVRASSLGGCQARDTLGRASDLA